MHFFDSVLNITSTNESLVSRDRVMIQGRELLNLCFVGNEEEWTLLRAEGFFVTHLFVETAKDKFGPFCVAQVARVDNVLPGQLA